MLDAFPTHMWAVTVTGALKRAAVAFIEEYERSRHRWYNGAVGRIGFDGGMETALTMRAIMTRDGTATVRAGATLLNDSDPAAEEAETVLKARALCEVLDGERAQRPAPVVVPRRAAVRALLVDHEDSFVHMLAGYFREAGAEVATYRHGFPESILDELRPDLPVPVTGPRPSRGFRALADPGPGARPRPAGFRRLPGAVRHGGALRRPAHAAEAGARQAGRDPAGRRRRPAPGRVPSALQGGPLPLAVRRPEHAAARPGGDQR